MRTNKVFIPEVFFTNDCLTGEDVVKSTRVLGDLDGVFQDKEAYGKMNKEQVVYHVSSYLPGFGEYPRWPVHGYYDTLFR